jgi:lipopolysaccharide exporter
MGKSGNHFLTWDILKSELAKHSFLLLVGSVIAQLITLLFYPIFSRIYSPEQFGTFALFVSITGIAAILSSGVYEQAILLPKKEAQALSLAMLAFAITLIQCVVFFAVAILFRQFIAERLFNNPLIKPFLLLVPVSVLFVNLAAILTGYANRKKYYGVISRNSIIQGFSTNISKLIFGVFKFTNFGLILGRLIGQFVSTYQLIYQIFKKTALPGEKIIPGYKEMKKVAVSYKNFPLFSMPISLLNAFSTALPILVLTKYFSANDAGQYSLASGVFLTPVMLITNSVSRVLNQQIIERINQQAPVSHLITRLLRVFMPVAAIFFFVFYFISENAFVFLFGQEWREAGKISGILLPWIFLVMFSSPINFTFDIFFKQRKALIIDIIYLGLRLTSMAIGVYYNNMFLAIELFVVSGCIVLTYNLAWYVSLLKNHDKNIKTIAK